MSKADSRQQLAILRVGRELLQICLLTDNRQPTTDNYIKNDFDFSTKYDILLTAAKTVLWR